MRHVIFSLNECVMLCYAGMTREDSGNYSCEVRGPQSVLLANVTHRVFVIGLLLTFYPRVALPARVLAMALCLSVCLSQVVVLSKRTGASGWIFFGKGASIVLFYAALRENSGLSESKGTSLWNFVLHSGIRKFHHNTPIVETCYQLSSATVDALRVINWTIVGQLS